MRTKILCCTQYTFPIRLPKDYGRLGNTAYSTVRSRGHKTCTVSSYLPAAVIAHQDHKKPESCHSLRLRNQLQVDSWQSTHHICSTPSSYTYYLILLCSKGDSFSVIGSWMLELKYMGNKMPSILAVKCLATFHSKCRFSLKILKQFFFHVHIRQSAKAMVLLHSNISSCWRFQFIWRSRHLILIFYNTKDF